MTIILSTIIGTLPVIVIVIGVAVRIEHRLTKVETNIEWLKCEFNKRFNSKE